MPVSVLIVASELSFLLHCYSGLHSDERIGQVEATTSRDEASVLIQTLHPDAIIFDAAAGDGSGPAAISRLCALAPNAAVVVTCEHREQRQVEMTAHACGAMGVLSREAFSAEALVRTMRGRPAATAEAVQASA